MDFPQKMCHSFPIKSAPYSWLQSAEVSFIEVRNSRLKLIAFGWSIKFGGGHMTTKEAKHAILLQEWTRMEGTHGTQFKQDIFKQDIVKKPL